MRAEESTDQQTEQKFNGHKTSIKKSLDPSDEGEIKVQKRRSNSYGSSYSSLSRSKQRSRSKPSHQKPRIGIDDRNKTSKSLYRIEDIFKTKLCEFYPRCPDGKNCRFAHGINEIRKNNDLFKTAMCNRLPDCRAGNHCNFAHNQSELRRVRYENNRFQNYHHRQNISSSSYRSNQGRTSKRSFSRSRSNPRKRRRYSNTPRRSPYSSSRSRSRNSSFSPSKRRAKETNTRDGIDDRAPKLKEKERYDPAEDSAVDKNKEGMVSNTKKKDFTFSSSSRSLPSRQLGKKANFNEEKEASNEELEKKEKEKQEDKERLSDARRKALKFSILNKPKFSEIKRAGKEEKKEEEKINAISQGGEIEKLKSNGLGGDRGKKDLEDVLRENFLLKKENEELTKKFALNEVALKGSAEHTAQQEKLDETTKMLTETQNELFSLKRKLQNMKEDGLLHLQRAKGIHEQFASDAKDQLSYLQRILEK